MKKRTTFTQLRHIATTAVVLSTLVACATNAPTESTPSSAGKSPQELVTQRANERWKLLVDKKFVQAHAYATPGFRALVSADAYQGRFGAAVVWVDAQAVDVKCEEETKCVARIRLDFKPLIGGKSGDKVSTHFDEIWLHENGQWWKYEDIKGN